jgi:hypothetical protein
MRILAYVATFLVPAALLGGLVKSASAQTTMCKGELPTPAMTMEVLGEGGGAGAGDNYNMCCDGSAATCVAQAGDCGHKGQYSISLHNLSPQDPYYRVWRDLGDEFIWNCAKDMVPECRMGELKEKCTMDNCCIDHYKAWVDLGDRLFGWKFPAGAGGKMLVGLPSPWFGVCLFNAKTMQATDLGGITVAVEDAPVSPAECLFFSGSQEVANVQTADFQFPVDPRWNAFRLCYGAPPCDHPSDATISPMTAPGAPGPCCCGPMQLLRDENKSSAGTWGVDMGQETPWLHFGQEPPLAPASPASVSLPTTPMPMPAQASMAGGCSMGSGRSSGYVCSAILIVGLLWRGRTSQRVGRALPRLVAPGPRRRRRKMGDTRSTSCLRVAPSDAFR